MTLSRADLTELAAKYAEMLRLRRADTGSATSPSLEGDEAMKAAMARLAAEFPGALRELDDFPLDLIESRRAALVRAAGSSSPRTDEAPIEPWMTACMAFHRYARGALAAKRWLGGRKDIDDETVAAFARAACGLPHPEDALAWQDDLAEIAHPPRGRISQLVLQRVAATLGVSPREARVLVFGPSRREHA